MRLLWFVSIVLIVYSCAENAMSEFDFLAGTWKVEGKDTYEVWEKNGKNELIGKSYQLHNHQKTVLETLSIKMSDGRIVYEATVPDQNEGKTIRFTLNSDIKSYFSFENIAHDFPKKIQYKAIHYDKIQITVSGDNGKSFSYTQLRQQ